MNNIWKYSLVLAFSIILDQLLKGTAQSLISMEGGFHPISDTFLFVRESNAGLIFGLHPFFDLKTLNTFSWIVTLVFIIHFLRRIVFYRNRSPIRGWGYTLLLMGFFSSWLDRYSQGSTLDYLGLKLGEYTLTFSVSDISSALGALILMTTISKRVTVK